MKIGVISDTHGTINPRVYEVFENVDLILHAGDIGTEDVITSLQTLAPVKAVHGNVDTFPLTTHYPASLALKIDGVGICVVHQFISLRNSVITDAAKQAGVKQIDVLIHGHTHQARLTREDGALIFNPGAAGKRRFSLKPAVGLLTIEGQGGYRPEIVYLEE